jgi:hypothetical protein
MFKLAVIGLGQALQVHYAKVLAMMDQIKITHLADPSVTKNDIGRLCGKAFEDKTKDAMFSPDGFSSWPPDTIALVLTPDHYPVIEQLAKIGCKRFIVEKPLVSRAEEVEKLAALVRTSALNIYAIDFYIPKLFGFQVACGHMKADDPRRSWVKETSLGGTADGGFALDGVEVTILESGSFCLPDLANRPWLENDPVIGGMLRDLGTHAFAPLIAAGVMSGDAKVELASLGKINDARDGIRRLEMSEVETYIHALLSEHGMPITATFGKIPFEKSGIWSLAIRGKEHQMFFVGLRTGQPSLFVTKEGQKRYDLIKPTYELVLEEALLYFEDKLPGFDGNMNALLGALRLTERIRESYR